MHEDDEEEPEEEELIAQATALMEILERAEIRTRSSTWIGRVKNIAYEWRTQTCFKCPWCCLYCFARQKKTKS